MNLKNKIKSDEIFSSCIDILKSEKAFLVGGYIRDSFLELESLDRDLVVEGNRAEILADKIIEKLNERTEPIIFVLWGDFAISKKKFITNPNHYILSSPHPSPLAAYRGFFNSKPFSKVNNILFENNKETIKW